jgi:hypothetical protein
LSWLALLDPSFDLRLIETMPDTFVLDADGTELQWGPVLDSRARLGLDAHDETGRASVQLDVASGQLLGSTWNLSPLDERGRHTHITPSPDAVLPRVLSVGLRQRAFDLEVGLQTSHWGLGMLANDGNTDPLFGRTDFGDRVVRARLATQPAGREVPLFLVLAADVVLADELARFSEGDRAIQGIAAALYRREHTEAGLYGVLRRQVDAGEDEPARHTRLGVLDVYARQRLESRVLDFELGVEAAAVLGSTELSRTYEAPAGVAVRAGGVAVRAVVERPAFRWHHRFAIASGDRSPDDGVLGDFRFDRDYDVGFVLFDEVISAVDLRTLDLVSDPELGAVPPDGAESLAAEGAFHQAVAIQDALELIPNGPLTLRVGGMLAWSTAPIANPYYSFRAGGVPRNHVGRAPGGPFLGSEVDWAVGTREVTGEGHVQASLVLQGGHAWPSEAFSGEIGRVDHLLLIFRLRYTE